MLELLAIWTSTILAAEAGGPNLVCHECGATLQVDDPDVGARFAAELRARYGFAADLAHRSIAGRCARCAGS